MIMLNEERITVKSGLIDKDHRLLGSSSFKQFTSSGRKQMLRAKEKERRSSIVYRTKERENGRLISREKTILGFAEYHIQGPKPTTSARARPPPRHGGRRGRLAPQATGLIPESTSTED
jgi:hypothetical protein